MGNVPPTIKSAGVPPERHAARVVAEMVQWLYGEEKRIDAIILDQIKSNRSHLGTPKAQLKFVKRMRAACGSRGIVDLVLSPAKRGKFKLMFTTWHVVRPLTADMLKKDEPIPERPWLSCEICFYSGTNDEPEPYIAFVLTHHAMQRLAERCNARNPDDLLDALLEIWKNMKQHMYEMSGTVAGDIKALHAKTRHLQLPVAGGIAILERAPHLGWVVKTVVPNTIAVTE
jgi:hypothetical protein